MRIAVGVDHAGFPAKKQLLEALRRDGHEVVDLGSFDPEPVDYPDVARKVAEEVSSGRCQRGILLCGTGIGMAIVANKFPGVRAAVCHDELTTQVSRTHNDANVLCLGGRTLTEEEILRLASLWLRTDFEGGRHARRVGKILDMEKELSRPPEKQ